MKAQCAKPGCEDLAINHILDTGDTWCPKHTPVGCDETLLVSSAEGFNLLLVHPRSGKVYNMEDFKHGDGNQA